MLRLQFTLIGNQALGLPSIFLAVTCQPSLPPSSIVAKKRMEMLLKVILLRDASNHHIFLLRKPSSCPSFYLQEKLFQFARRLVSHTFTFILLHGLDLCAGNLQSSSLFLVHFHRSKCRVEVSLSLRFDSVLSLLNCIQYL